jgi:hypothetical protein
MGRPNVALEKVWRHLGTPDDSFATDLFQLCDNRLRKRTSAFHAEIYGQDRQSFPASTVCRRPSSARFSCRFAASAPPKAGGFAFSVARNHLSYMIRGNVATSPRPEGLQKTNHTGLHSEPKADCLGKSTSSSASR